MYRILVPSTGEESSRLNGVSTKPLGTLGAIPAPRVTNESACASPIAMRVGIEILGGRRFIAGVVSVALGQSFGLT